MINHVIYTIINCVILACILFIGLFGHAILN